MNDSISRQAAIETVKKHYRVDNDLLEVIAYEIEALPSAQLAQDLPNGCTDTISRAAIVDAIEGVDWYHMTDSGEMVHGANSAEDQPWYKAEDIYKAIKGVPSAQLVQRNARVFQGIIVEYPSISAYPEYEGKPYFSIKYTENGQEFIGYGTYKPEVLSEYLKEYFMPPAQRGWTYIEEELPETIINKHTHDYQEYNCLCDFGEYGFDVRTYKFGNEHFWNGGGAVDKYVTAWQPLPEIPDALKQKPWEGGRDEKN